MNYNNQKIRNTNYLYPSNLPSNKYYYQINNFLTKYIINEFNPNIIYNTKNYDFQNNNIRNNKFKNYNINTQEPDNNFNSGEFLLVNQIGKGSFGKIYCIQWIKNNKLYVMKNLELQTLEELKEFQGLSRATLSMKVPVLGPRGGSMNKTSAVIPSSSISLMNSPASCIYFQKI